MASKKLKLRILRDRDLEKLFNDCDNDMDTITNALDICGDLSDDNNCDSSDNEGK